MFQVTVTTCDNATLIDNLSCDILSYKMNLRCEVRTQVVSNLSGEASMQTDHNNAQKENRYVTNPIISKG
jgi:hypothetical protein